MSLPREPTSETEGISGWARLRAEGFGVAVTPKFLVWAHGSAMCGSGRSLYFSEPQKQGALACGVSYSCTVLGSHPRVLVLYLGDGPISS